MGIEQRFEILRRHAQEVVKTEFSCRGTLACCGAALERHTAHEKIRDFLRVMDFHYPIGVEKQAEGDDGDEAHRSR